MVRKTAQSGKRGRPGTSKKARALHEQLSAAVSAIEQLQPATPEAANVLALLHSWLTDESGYDERAWPQLKKALDRERARAGARRLFDG